MNFSQLTLRGKETSATDGNNSNPQIINYITLVQKPELGAFGFDRAAFDVTF